MRVFVTGGGRGFGRALALELGSRGHGVVATHRGGARSHWNADSSVAMLRCDVTDHHDVRAAASEAVRIMGGIDVWVNNAAVCIDPGYRLSGSAQKDTGAGCPLWPEMSRDLIGVNVVGALVGSHAASEAGAAHVYNVYGSGHDGRVHHSSGHGVYAASKAFVSVFTRVAATHASGRARVPAFHAIVPGPMTTPLLERELSDMDPLRASLLLALAVDPREAAAVAADGVERDFIGNTTRYTEIDCYTPCLLAKAVRMLK